MADNISLKPLFSILMASYNREKYIEESINSALSQDYPNIEVVVVEDCSTDNTLSIIRGLAKADSRIRVFTNDTNMGCGFTKNRCGFEARGEICGYLDPDDILEPDAVSGMVNAHLQHPDVSLVYSRLRYFYDEKKDVLYDTTNQEQIASGSTYLTGKQVVISHFSSFKKLAFDKVGGINQAIKRAVDRDLNYKMEEVGKLFFLDKYLYRYRVHDDGLSTKKNRSKAFYWLVLVARDACKRRSIEPEEVVAKLIDYYTDQCILEFESQKIRVLETKVRDMESNINAITRTTNSVKEEYSKTLSSFSFKLGRLLTLPIRRLRSYLFPDKRE